MIRQTTLRYGLYAAIGTLLLTLTGIFASFAGRDVIASGSLIGIGNSLQFGGLTLDTVFLIIVLAGTAYLTASRTHREPITTIVNGVIASLIVAGALALLVILQSSVDLTFVFPDIGTLLGGTLTLGETELLPGVVRLLLTGFVLGILGGLLPLASPRLRRVATLSLALVIVVGLLVNQIRNVVTLPDGLALALSFGLAYLVAHFIPSRILTVRLLAGALVGGIVGMGLALLAANGALEPGGLLHGPGSDPTILGVAANNRLLVFAIIFGVVGAVGGLATVAAQTVHNGSVFFIVSLVLLGILNWQGNMTPTAAVLALALLAAALWWVPTRGAVAAQRYETLPRNAQKSLPVLAGLVGLAVLLVAPGFLGQNITNVLVLVGLYIVMGIGLNVVVGFAGLLDLGYVAFFAIGAYTVGLLTTPSMLTCGGVPPSELTADTIMTTCTGLMTFWEAWPVAVVISALAGILLGIPVLRLRGDYLAIVTLGFGEIIRIIVKYDDFKPLLGAAQGIPNIPRPVIDLTSINPAWRIELSGAEGVYYLALLAIIITAIVATRLANARIGRAWRAMRADEDVAQAIGINLTRTKLAAFAIGAAFAGMGGAVAATNLYGAYPDSFTLLVSINVLSLIIIGGLGSLPGVVIGALVLVGLPEVLRELGNYRLLAFGVLLVVAMLLKPEGLIPPSVRQLSRDAAERHLRKGATP